jgi:hypothetical protein
VTGEEVHDRGSRRSTGPAVDVDPDVADSLPRWRRGEFAKNAFAPGLTAWSLLSAYLALVGDRREVDAADAVPRMGPGMIAGHVDYGAESMKWIKPWDYGSVVKAIFVELTRWLHELGYVPDRRAWFAGARSYLEVMVPAEHRAEALRLLDYEVLQAEQLDVGTTRLRLLQIPEWNLEDPENGVWFATAMRAHPVAMIHAAAALASSIFAGPDRAVAARRKAFELTRRAGEYQQLMQAAPAPPAPAAGGIRAFPAFNPALYVPVWDRPGQDRGNTSRPIDVAVVYDGPPMTPWRVAYLYAEVIAWLPLRPVDEDSVRVIIARAITIAAHHAGITAPTDVAVPTPGVFAPICMGQLYLQHLDAVRCINEFVDRSWGHTPAVDEPGHTTFTALHDWVSQLHGDPTPDLLADDKQWVESIARWEHHREQARVAMLSAVTRVTSAPGAARLPLGSIGDYLNAHQRAP